MAVDKTPTHPSHSQSSIPENIIRELTWRVIAVKRGFNARWTPVEKCPYSDKSDPLKACREAAARGELIMAQKKIAPFCYELWAKTPSGETKPAKSDAPGALIPQPPKNPIRAKDWHIDARFD